ncbi:MAG: sugar ABC transporter substrate-binding protein [Treponema sp.]|jgi:multiple sugar transport system substrate-binding protein|nr:sugar ABC transporter substrate-binding protein [Treponema sp.]
MKKGFKVCIISLLVLILVMTACRSGKNENSSGDRTTIRYSTLANGRDANAIKELVDHAMSGNPDINIEFEPVVGDWWDLNQKYVSQIAAGDPPDIIRHAESFMTLLSTNDYAVDLGPRIKTLDMSNYYENTFSRYAGKQIMVPVGIYSQALFYNRDMFEKAGVPEPRGYDNPWTFDEFRAAAKALTGGSGTSRVYGFAIPFDPAKWSGFLWGNGGDFHDADGKPVFNSPRFKETCQFLVDLIQVDDSMASPANAQAISPWDLFESGRCAMIITGQWDLVNVKAITDFKTGVAASPYNPKNPGAAPGEPMFLDGYCISKGSKFEEQAWKVILSFVDEEASAINIKNGVFGWPSNRNYAEAHQAELFTPPIDPDQVDALMGLAYTHNWPALPNWTETEQSIRRYFELMTLGEISVNDACESIQAENVKFYQ